MMQLSRWETLMHAFGFSENEATWCELAAAYAEKHRHYHTSEHINACLSHLDKVHQYTDHPEEVELALWFHDSIYIPRKSNNELKSAEWAQAFLNANQAQVDVVRRVYNLIMVTRHNVPASTKDEEVLLDIDLSILGAKPEIYEQFENAIRKEYKWVPWFLYKKKRKEILESFLNRERIYITDYFFEELESQARFNLASAILKL